MNLKVQLPQFEGPLALLLYLIRKEEMDIFNIQIHRITEQYLEHIKLMKELDLEVAGEFVSMAATLIQIKSQLLLPTYNENGEVVESEDPRKILVQRLLEYQKYQEAAKLLYERPLVGRDLWLRGVREKFQVGEGDIETSDNPVFSLIAAYRQSMRTMKKKIHKVAVKLQSIASRILELKDHLKVGERTTLFTLMQQHTLGVEDSSSMRKLLITFLSLLELGKMGFVSVFQSGFYEDIHVETKKPIETDVISRVEEYDNIHSQEAAEKMISKSLKEAELQESELQESDAEAVAEIIESERVFGASDEDILAAELEGSV
jgi:segregation and condensation protein A